MAMSASNIKEKLISESVEFKRLYDRHQSCEKRLDVLNSHTYLTSDEEREMADIKKRKLNLKDKMQRLIEKYKAEYT